MAIALPSQFEQKMKTLLGEQFEMFISSYEKPRKYGLRVNELKIAAQDWLTLNSMKSNVNSIPWTTTGFYYEEHDRPAKHPHYQAGLYYIQEPSAMVPVELLDVQPGQRVLDLCAAPGGKSTQIASKLLNKGVLVSNDLATERTKALAKNIELAGIRNAVILNEHPNNLVDVFPQYFDRVLVDAPCSGEGMFRKNDEMIAEWFNYSVDRCAKMQDDILKVVAKMIAPGGRLVYSTCTFSPEENETQIASFIADNDDFEVVSIDATNWGWANGRAEWVSEEVKMKLTEAKLQSINGTLRLWPHLTDGEGHFVAVLQRKGETIRHLQPDHVNYTIEDIDFSGVNIANSQQHQLKMVAQKRDRKEKQWNNKKIEHITHQKTKQNKLVKSNNENDSILTLMRHMCHDFINIKLNCAMKAISLGSRIYLQPNEVPSLAKLKIVRAGWFVGELKNNKIIPSQPFVMAISKQEMLKFVHLSYEEQLERFLRGETLFLDNVIIEGNYEKHNGYACIVVDGFVIGYVKIVDQMLKNELPAGWRQLS